MNQRQPLKKAFPALLGIGLISFLSGFWLTYQKDRLAAGEEAQLALSHFVYALQMKDDLAVIDFSHQLEKLESVVAFQALLDSKPICAGGNRGALANPCAPGVHFFVPSRWVCVQTMDKGQGHSLSWMLILRLNPGPIVVGMGCWLGSLMTSLLIWFLVSGKNNSPETPKEMSPPQKGLRHKTDDSRKLDGLSAFTGKPYLLLDDNYVVIKVSPEALPLLGKAESELLNSHLIDLNPSPLLTESMQKGGTHGISNAFMSLANLNATPHPVPQGIILVLEKT